MNSRDDTDSLEEGEIQAPEGKYGLPGSKQNNVRNVGFAVPLGQPKTTVKPVSRSVKNKRPASRPSRPVRRGGRSHARRSRSRSRSSSPPPSKLLKASKSKQPTDTKQIQKVKDTLTSITNLECRYQNLDSAIQGFVHAVSTFRQLIQNGTPSGPSGPLQQQRQQQITLMGSLIIRSIKKIKRIHDSRSGADRSKGPPWPEVCRTIKQVLSPITQSKLCITVDEKHAIDDILNGSFSKSTEPCDPRNVALLTRRPSSGNSNFHQRTSTIGTGANSVSITPTPAILQNAVVKPHLNHGSESETGSIRANFGFTKTFTELLSQRKLCLVLDLDHTLLQSVMYGELMPSTKEWLEKRLQATVNLPPEKKDLFKLESIQMFTKLRPGVREFLQQASKLFELCIHTNGNATYAAAVVSLLDPNDTYFSGRVIAQGAERGESTMGHLPKALNYGLQGRDAVSIIMDDTQAVWRAHEENLVTIDRYIYFPTVRSSSSGQSSVKSLLEQNKDEHPQQGLLTRMSTVLGRVHRAVFEKNQICDVRMALKLERQKVLEGVHLVFSRVIPLGQDPTTHELWKLAESFGARCSTNLVPGVTHLVAGDAATEKAEAARAAGISIVDPSWLRFCCAFWKKADESKFPVTTSGRVVL